MLNRIKAWRGRRSPVHTEASPPSSTAPEAPPALRARTEALAPWFQSLDLGNGIRIPRDPRFGNPDYPGPLWQRLMPLIPRDLTGMRVIDVGCNAGFFSLEVKRRGADYVLGIEAVPHHLEQARLVRELSGCDIDLRLLSIYDVSADLGEFDLTLCLGVVYHLKHPLLGLERLAAITRGTLIVESAIIPEFPFAVPEHFGPRAAPLGFMEYPPLGPEADAYRNWFVPSARCLRAWIEVLGFTVLTSSAVGDRAIVVSRRAGDGGAGAR